MSQRLKKRVKSGHIVSFTADDNVYMLVKI